MAPANSIETYCTFTLASDVTAGGLPSEEEIAHARAVVAAFEAAEAEGSASIQLDGYFIDYPIVYKSQRILALADQLLG